jgi:hypothetical protein
MVLVTGDVVVITRMTDVGSMVKIHVLRGQCCRILHHGTGEELWQQNQFT